MQNNSHLRHEHSANRTVATILAALPRVLLAVAIALVAIFSSTGGTAHAHSPHDLIRTVEISPNYAADGTAFIITSTAAWRIPVHLFRSVDRGTNWQSVTAGLDNRSYESDIKFSPDFSHDGTIFLATKGDGIYRSTDAGETWSSSSEGLETLEVSLLALSPSFGRDNSVLAAGVSGGLYQSMDRGDTWSNVVGTDVRIRSLDFGRLNDGSLFALAGDTRGNLLVSGDGGATWRVRLTLPKAGAITAVAVSPVFDTDSTYFLGTGKNGLWRVVDQDPLDSNSDEGVEIGQMPLAAFADNVSLEGLDTEADVLLQVAAMLLPSIVGIPQAPSTGSLAIGDVAVSPAFADDGTILVAAQKRQLFRSQDGGTTWSGIGSEEALTHHQADEYGQPDFFDVDFSPSFAMDSTVYLAGFAGLFQSQDAGNTWKELESLGVGMPTGLSVSPGYEQDQHVVVSTYHAGSIISQDGGSTWQTWNRGLSDGRLYGIEFSPNFDADDSIFSFERSRVRRIAVHDSAYDWESWPFGEMPIPPDSDKMVKVNFPQATAISPDFASDSTIFMGTRRYGLFVSNNGGQTWRQTWHRQQSIESMAVSPEFASDKTIFVSLLNDGVFKSTDGGATWKPAQEGMIRRDANDIPRGQFVAFLVISPDFAQDQTLFAATNDGLFVTRDSGEQWQELPQFADRFVVAAAVSPDFANDQSLFVSVKGHGLFKSTDGGQSFAAVGHGLLANQHVLLDLEMSPAYADDRTMFGIADHVFRSTDGGETWQVLDRPIRYENHKDPIRYEGNWTQSWGADNSMSSVMKSDTELDRATLNFSGTGVDWIGDIGLDLGMSNVYVDGELSAVVDQFSPEQKHEVQLFSIRNLEPGPHSIEIEVSGQRNPNSIGSGVGIDAFDVFGHSVGAGSE